MDRRQTAEGSAQPPLEQQDWPRRKEIEKRKR
jgi:hypothetical protein